MIFVLYFILLIYFLAIIALIYGFYKINTFDKLDLEPRTKFSIVVPFRNEAKNLPILLESFLKLDYPTNLFEVILVDDESEEAFSSPSSAFNNQKHSSIKFAQERRYFDRNEISQKRLDYHYRCGLHNQ